MMNVAALLSAIYFSLVWMVYIYLNLGASIKITFCLTLFVGAVSYFAFAFITRKLRKAEGFRFQELPLKKKIGIFIAVAVVVFCVRLIWISAYYPGSFSPDSIGQYGQALSGHYNDWHPVWHTILFFTIPLKIFGNPAAIIIVQNLYLAMILGYMAVTIAEMWNGKVAIISVAYIVLNPYIGHIMLFPWKDVGFALGGLLCSVMIVRLILKKQEPAALWKLIVLGILLSWTTLFRHNAILFTGPLLLVLLFYANRKSRLTILISFVVSLFAVKILLYGALDVEKPNRRVVECSGLPLTVIGNVVKETPDLLDEELSHFAYSIVPKEKWVKNYRCGSFNSVKHKDKGINASVIEKKGYRWMWETMFTCFKVSPRASWHAFFALTDIVYGFETGLEGDVGAYITKNSYGIAYANAGNNACKTLVKKYTSLINGTMFKYFRTYGVVLFVMLVVGLSRLHFRQSESWKRASLFAPIFCYDFGTMLLLTGPDSRFFCVTFLVAPLLIVFTFSKEENDA